MAFAIVPKREPVNAACAISEIETPVAGKTERFGMPYYDDQFTRDDGK
jgi:hypothetical protein